MNSGSSYSVYTVNSGTVTAGAVIEPLRLKGAGIEIPAVIVGEEGRGRELGVVPVANPPRVPCPRRGQDVWGPSGRCDECSTPLGEPREGSSTRSHPDAGMAFGRLMAAELGQTKAGRPKFLSRDLPTSADCIIAVFVTRTGFRGSNAHTGDRAGWKCGNYACLTTGRDAVVPVACTRCGATGSWDGPRQTFEKFPGEIIARGRIAQGAAGRMSSGEQIIALMPRGAVFRTAYSGRLYGAPSSHYYKWDGKQVLAATWEERAAADLF